MTSSSVHICRLEYLLFGLFSALTLLLPNPFLTPYALASRPSLTSHLALYQAFSNSFRQPLYTVSLRNAILDKSFSGQIFSSTLLLSDSIGCVSFPLCQLRTNRLCSAPFQSSSIFRNILTRSSRGCSMY